LISSATRAILKFIDLSFFKENAPMVRLVRENYKRVPSNNIKNEDALAKRIISAENRIKEF
jgi:hypothetical protein